MQGTKGVRELPGVRHSRHNDLVLEFTVDEVEAVSSLENLDNLEATVTEFLSQAPPMSLSELRNEKGVFPADDDGFCPVPESKSTVCAVGEGWLNGLAIELAFKLSSELMSVAGASDKAEGDLPPVLRRW